MGWVGDGSSRGVVVIAELFLAQAGAGAAAAVGEDVAALVLFGCFGGVLHGPSPRGTFLRKVFGGKGLSLDFPFTFRLNAKARLVGRAFFLSISIIWN